MKKVAICLITLIIFSLITSSILAASFTDVPEDAYYAEAAERMAEKGILAGDGDGAFYGDRLLTRAEFAALACKILGKVDEALELAGETIFTDIPATHWSTGYVNYAVSQKIINGDGDGNYRPNDSVKYEEALKVIVCIVEPDNNITIDDPKDWSKNYLAEADKLGLTDNLIGKKGEFMKRSDIAVITDKAVSVIEEDAAQTTTTEATTTEKPSTPSNPRPVVTTTATDAPEEEPIETTIVTDEPANEPEDTATETLPVGPDDGEWA